MEKTRLLTSQLFHETFGRSIASARGLLSENKLQHLDPGDYFVSHRPIYVSQIANARKSSVIDLYKRIDDIEAAERFGANDLDEFGYWAGRSCAIACLQMVLMTVYGDKFRKTTMDLVKEGLDLKGYDVDRDVGWYHKALVKLAQKYGIKASSRKFIPSSTMALLVLNNNFVIASVKHKTETNTDSHLFLVYGFRIDRKGKLSGFWLHDPSNYLEEGEEKYIRKSEFDKISTRRIIILKPLID